MQIAQTLNIGQEAASQGLPGAPEVFEAAKAGSYFGTTLSGLLGGIMLIGSLMVLLYLLWGGIEWITSGGDQSKVSKARDKITQSVIGLIVLASSTAIFIILQSFLGIEVINFSGALGGGSSGGGSGSGSSGDCVVGQRGSDGGAGGYCTENGAAIVQCFGPGQGASGLPYNHYEPCLCLSGSEKSTYNFSSCN